MSEGTVKFHTDRKSQLKIFLHLVHSQDIRPNAVRGPLPRSWCSTKVTGWMVPDVALTTRTYLAPWLTESRAIPLSKAHIETQATQPTQEGAAQVL